MNNKEIYIDNIDVSGCEFCDYKSSNIPQCRIRLASFEPICKGYNCYYKNWQRAERKLERIAKVCDKFIPDHFKILLIINGGVIEE